jgi:hypothetical protein
MLVLSLLVLMLRSEKAARFASGGFLSSGKNQNLPDNR